MEKAKLDEFAKNVTQDLLVSTLDHKYELEVNF